jgi:hypothetical protein
VSPVGIALFCTSPEYFLMKRPKKMNLDLFWRRSNKTRQIQYGVAYSRIFLCWMTTEVSDDLLENSVMSDHSKDTTVIVFSVLALMQV